MNPKRAQTPNHFEPCATLGGITQRMLGLEIAMKQMGESLTRLEGHVTQISEKLSLLIDHGVRIERLEADHAGCQASQEKMWTILRAVQQTADQALAAIQDVKASAMEDRTTMREAVGWAIGILSAVAGVFYTGWQMAVGK
ncbi:MAG: hypothetical protein HQM00_11305 [Magnetococcales bacterium]|nr:hypothetical protein [Magnetococcales bacterium]